MQYAHCSVLLTFVLAVAVFAAARADPIPKGRGSSTRPGAQLTAGVAVIDLDPPAGYRMAGYFNERLNTATHDPLRAKAIFLEQGPTRAALVVCDLLGIPLEVSTLARQRAAEKTGIPLSNLVMAATHTHTGPLYFGAVRDLLHRRAMAAQGRDPHETVDYGAALTEKLVEVVAQARAAARPVNLEAGVAAEKRLSFNRRFHMKDGPVQFNPGQQNPNIVRPAGPIDPDVGILLLRDSERRHALASLTVFALHLDTVGGMAYSADYPYYLERELRKTLGADLASMFGVGTCGDVNHIDVKINTRRSSEEIGSLLAETVRSELPRLRPVGDPCLAVRSATVQAPLQQYTEQQVAAAARDVDRADSPDLPFLRRVEACKIMELKSRTGSTLPLEVQVFRLSREVAIVTLPGEVLVDLGLAIKRASPFPITMVVELANDDPGYIPTAKAFAEGSYETVNTLIQPGGGEMMVEAAVRLLKELAG